MTLSLCAHANPNTWAVAPAWNQSSDSDGLNVRKAFATALPSYTNGLQWQGVEWQDQQYIQNGTALRGHGINYTAQNLDALTGLGYNLKVGVNQGPEKTIAIGDWNYNNAFSSQLNWGVFASRDWVESLGALQQGLYYDLAGGNLDYQLHPRVTMVGSLAQTRFSDGQDRQQKRVRAIWDAWPSQGITLQLVGVAALKAGSGTHAWAKAANKSTTMGAPHLAWPSCKSPARYKATRTSSCVQVAQKPWASMAQAMCTNTLMCSGSGA
jgi:hypothetical protein